MLNLVADKLVSHGLIDRNLWMADMRLRGELVMLYRQYYDGYHRARLTKQMKKMLRISDDLYDRMNVNYCEMVVDSMASRLTVDKVQADSEDASAWADTLLRSNRFDALQIDVREAALRDGETFVMVETLADGTQRLVHEPAWDGYRGAMVVYDHQKNIVAGVKIWTEPTGDYANIYYPDRIERYRISQGALLMMDEPEMTTRAGQQPGVPLVPFVNKGKGWGRGTSELVNVVPLQDSLNRTWVSMVMTAELSAFQIRWAKGFAPPQDLMPGSWVTFGEDWGPDQIEALKASEVGTLDQAALVPFIEQSMYIIRQIGTITSTPLPETMGGDSQSGEALKQREIGLLASVGRAQVQMGNSWENVLALAHRQATLYAVQSPPAAAQWETRWKDAEIRNDADVIGLASVLQSWGYEREALRQLATLSQVNWDDAKIEALMAEKLADANAALMAASGDVPGFGEMEPLAI